MDSDKRKNIILGSVAGVLVLGALILLFRDSLFSSAAESAGAPLDPNVAQGVAEQLGDTSAEPPPENPKPKGSGKLGGGSGN